MGAESAVCIRGRISTHALREEGDRVGVPSIPCPEISTHALREEGDLEGIHRAAGGVIISTHALREEGDP